MTVNRRTVILMNSEKNCLKEKSAPCENVVMSCQSSLNTDPIQLTGLQQLPITVGNPNPIDPNLTNPIKPNNNTADKGSIGSSCHPLGQVGLQARHFVPT